MYIKVLTLGMNTTSIASTKMHDISKTNPTSDVDNPSPSDKRERKMIAICTMKSSY